MRRFHWLFKFNKSARILVAGLLVVGMLGGCTKPFINVQVDVDTCPSGAGGQGKPIPMGLCSSDNQYTGTIKPAGYEVCKDFNGNVIACTGNEQCTGPANVSACNSPTGMDANRRVCKTVWVQSAAGSMNGSCVCTGYY